MASVKIENLDKAIIKELKTYQDSVAYKTKQAITELAKNCAKEVKQKAQSYGWNDYSRGWKSKKLEETTTSVKYVVHNDKHYRLTHLLEKGHLVVINGKVRGNTKAYPHIKPAEDKLEKEIERLLKDNL